MAEQNSKATIRAIMLALLACAIWASNFIIARDVNGLIPPVGFSFWRWVVALICLAPFALPHLRQELLLVSPVWPAFIVMGMIGVGMFNALMYVAAHETTSHQLALISCLSPVLILFLVGVLRIETLSPLNIAGTVVALAGAVVIITHGNVSHLAELTFNRGDQISFFAAWLWAVYCILLRYKPRAMHAAVFLFILTVIGLLTMLPFYLYETMFVAVTPLTLKTAGIFIYVGIGASVVAWFSWNKAVEAIGAVNASLIYYSIPIFTAVLAITILHEPIAVYHVIGFLVVFCGVVIASLQKLGLVKR